MKPKNSAKQVNPAQNRGRHFTDNSAGWHLTKLFHQHLRLLTEIPPPLFFLKKTFRSDGGLCVSMAPFWTRRSQYSAQKRRFLTAAPRNGLRSTQIMVHSKAPRPLFLKHVRWRKTEWQGDPHQAPKTTKKNILFLFVCVQVNVCRK